MGPCLIFTCKNRGIHQFPENEQLRARWIKDCRLLRTRKVPEFAGVCSDHFETSDFDFTPPRFEGDEVTKCLKENAVPSIFPWSSAQKNETIIDEPKKPPKVTNPKPKKKIPKKIIEGTVTDEFKVIPPTWTYSKKHNDKILADVNDVLESERNLDTEQHIIIIYPLTVENPE